jgi:NadR type nicotinamide-nucleotide adenylyltransferase
MTRHRRFRRGLVVGKFAPLHLGHEYLIESAARHCDELFLLSWSRPEMPRCGVEQRRRWLAERVPRHPALVLDQATLDVLCIGAGVSRLELPRNDAPDELPRRFVARLLADVLGLDVDAVFTSESYGDGFAAVLTQEASRRDPSHPGVTHVCVDQHRRHIGVRGQDVRAHPEAWRDQVAPAVYVDLLPRVCLLGGESSGKTTLAQALASRLETAWVREYGRERWIELGGGILAPDALVHIAERQIQLEVEAAQQARRWLVCDTSPLTTLQYCLLDHGHAPPRLHELAARRYDLAVLCRNDFAFEQDGTRRNVAFSQQQFEANRMAAQAQGLPCVEVTGRVDERVEQVLAAMAQLVKVE